MVNISLVVFQFYVFFSKKTKQKKHTLFSHDWLWCHFWCFSFLEVFFGQSGQHLFSSTHHGQLEQLISSTLILRELHKNQTCQMNPDHLTWKIWHLHNEPVCSMSSRALTFIIYHIDLSFRDEPYGNATCVWTGCSTRAKAHTLHTNILLIGLKWPTRARWSNTKKRKGLVYTWFQRHQTTPTSGGINTRPELYCVRSISVALLHCFTFLTSFIVIEQRSFCKNRCNIKAGEEKFQQIKTRARKWFL